MAQRLRAIVDGDEPGAGAGDHGLAADAMTLAAYLDGSMSAPERDAFEAELVRSPARRDDLIAAAAWIDELAAKQATPPADATALAIALQGPTPAGPAARGAGFAGFIEWLLPRPRLAMATSAIASIAIVAVGIDIALHTSPQFRQAIQFTLPGGPGPGDVWRDTSARQLPPDARPPAPQPGDPVILTAETINTMIAYRDNPSPARQKALLAALARAGTAPIPADQVRVIMLQPQLYERITQQRNNLPTWISARLTIGGELVIAIAK